jgi:L-amino acid N-acyltransferase YncA
LLAGLGKALMAEIIERSENVNIWVIQSGIFPENIASMRLHSPELGFRQIGMREKIGLMQCGEYKGQWRDIVMMERRSQVVGVCI